ncbi:unnamed protein product [Candida verbasci]|uniref:CinA C-terminal domain-containing protein n=1 Tax=Candida verbasci TaxID=1227364 RepID=A0A9W4XCV9_9ASCO|nr:unnamed protein product [Candida verbasci]
MTFPPNDIISIVDEIAEILRSRNQTLAISEAACGGLISAYIVSVPGASDFYIGGKLTYSLRQRLKNSGWSDFEISKYVGPSEQVALKLARTTKYEFGSNYVLSETGFAGPSSNLHLREENEEKNNLEDVGNVYIGLSGPNGDSSAHFKTDNHDRSYNMMEFAKLALQFLLEKLKE